MRNIKHIMGSNMISYCTSTSQLRKIILEKMWLTKNPQSLTYLSYKNRSGISGCCSMFASPRMASKGMWPGTDFSSPFWSPGSLEHSSHHNPGMALSSSLCSSSTSFR